MKLTPEEKRIQKLLQPGSITLEGFLGDDPRNFTDIIQEDLSILERLNISHTQIADKLQALTDEAFETYDGKIALENGATLEYFSFRGKVPSPFPGQKPAPKGYLNYNDPNSGISFCWTPLNIKMIRDYAFFEGKGSANRLDPVSLYKAFFC
jgi:hypothetical protein